MADRIEGFLATLDTDLLTEARRTTAPMFRELLLDAMSRGGDFDTSRRVRVACLRTARLLMYRIADAGYGFRASDLPSSSAPAHRPPSSSPLWDKRPCVRGCSSRVSSPTKCSSTKRATKSSRRSISDYWKNPPLRMGVLLDAPLSTRT